MPCADYLVYVRNLSNTFTLSTIYLVEWWTKCAHWPGHVGPHTDCNTIWFVLVIFAWICIQFKLKFYIFDMSNQSSSWPVEWQLKHKQKQKVSQFTDHKNNGHKLKIETCIELIELSARTPYRLLLSFLFHTIFMHMFLIIYFRFQSIDWARDRSPSNERTISFRFCMKLLRVFDLLSFSVWALA